MTRYVPGQPNRWRGLLLMIGAGVCWSTGGVLVRSTELTNGWEIVFWRSLFMVLTLGAILTVWHRGAVLRKFAAVGVWGGITPAFLALTVFFFIIALMMTTVANTLVTMSIMPFVAALLGWLLLKEPIRPRTWAARPTCSCAACARTGATVKKRAACIADGRRWNWSRRSIV